MNISNNIANPSLNVNVNETRNVRHNNDANANVYKDAFKLDINPRYLGGEPEKVAIADSEALFYTSYLEVVKKP